MQQHRSEFDGNLVLYLHDRNISFVDRVAKAYAIATNQDYFFPGMHVYLLNWLTSTLLKVGKSLDNNRPRQGTSLFLNIEIWTLYEWLFTDLVHSPSLSPSLVSLNSPILPIFTHFFLAAQSAPEQATDCLPKVQMVLKLAANQFGTNPTYYINLLDAYTKLYANSRDRLAAECLSIILDSLSSLLKRQSNPKKTFTLIIDQVIPLLFECQDMDSIVGTFIATNLWTSSNLSDMLQVLNHEFATKISTELVWDGQIPDILPFIKTLVSCGTAGWPIWITSLVYQVFASKATLAIRPGSFDRISVFNYALLLIMRDKLPVAPASHQSHNKIIEPILTVLANSKVYQHRNDELYRAQTKALHHFLFQPQMLSQPAGTGGFIQTCRLNFFFILDELINVPPNLWDDPLWWVCLFEHANETRQLAILIQRLLQLMSAKSGPLEIPCICKDKLSALASTNGNFLSEPLSLLHHVSGEDDQVGRFKLAILGLFVRWCTVAAAKPIEAVVESFALVMETKWIAFRDCLLVLALELAETMLLHNSRTKLFVERVWQLCSVTTKSDDPTNFAMLSLLLQKENESEILPNFDNRVDLLFKYLPNMHNADAIKSVCSKVNWTAGLFAPNVEWLLASARFYELPIAPLFIEQLFPLDLLLKVPKDLLSRYKAVVIKRLEHCTDTILTLKLAHHLMVLDQYVGLLANMDLEEYLSRNDDALEQLLINFIDVVCDQSYEFVFEKIANLSKQSTKLFLLARLAKALELDRATRLDLERVNCILDQIDFKTLNPSKSTLDRVGTIAKFYFSTNSRWNHSEGALSNILDVLMKISRRVPDCISALETLSRILAQLGKFEINNVLTSQILFQVVDEVIKLSDCRLAKSAAQLLVGSDLGNFKAMSIRLPLVIREASTLQIDNASNLYYDKRIEFNLDVFQHVVLFECSNSNDGEKSKLIIHLILDMIQDGKTLSSLYSVATTKLLYRIVLAKHLYVLRRQDLLTIINYFDEAAIRKLVGNDDAINTFTGLLSFLISSYFKTMFIDGTGTSDKEGDGEEKREAKMFCLIPKFISVIVSLMNAMGMESEKMVTKNPLEASKQLGMLGRLITDLAEHRSKYLAMYMYPIILHYIRLTARYPLLRKYWELPMYSVLCHLETELEATNSVDVEAAPFNASASMEMDRPRKRAKLGNVLHLERINRMIPKDASDQKSLFRNLVSDFRKSFKFTGKA